MTEREEGVIRGMEVVNDWLDHEVFRCKRNIFNEYSSEDIRLMISGLTLRTDGKQYGAYILGKIEALEKMKRYIDMNVELRSREDDK